MNEDVVSKVLQELTQRTGIATTWRKNKGRLIDKGLDGYVTFRVGRNKLEVPAELKSRVTSAHLPELEDRKKAQGILLVLADVIAPREQYQLRQLGIFYIDSAGNAFVQQEHLFLQIEGRKAEARPVADVRAFSKGGIRVIFQLLIENDLINTTVREIAQKADVSLDTVHKTLNGLKGANYIIPLNKKTVLWKDKRELLTIWMNEYERRLKPAIFAGRFDFLNTRDYDNWNLIKLDKSKTYWGGEPAAELLTRHLKPAQWTIYTSESGMELVKNYRMIPKKDGNIWVYKQFWPESSISSITVPPLLVYTDLVNTGDRRNINVAKRIFDEYLQDQFQTT